MAWKWRATLIAWHRDLGFLSVGLTLVYAVSGVAVNHRHDWDYNYATERGTRTLGVPSALLGVPAPQVSALGGGSLAAGEGRLAREREGEVVAAIVRGLGRTAPPRKVIWRGPTLMSLFFGEADADVVDYELTTGAAQGVAKTERFLLRDMNFLHLNERSDVWTWFGDAFAVVLIFLALSGAVVVKGRRGLTGRGGFLMAVGFALPVLAIVLLR